MDIDWITVSAQIINFLILVGLLKYFLYKPVIAAMNKREQMVTRRLKEAEQREQAATELKDSYARQTTELERNRDQVMKSAREEASKLKSGLLSEARSEVANTRASWQQQAELEKQQFVESLQQKLAQSVLQVARKALGDLANAQLEAQVVSTFLSNLNSLDKEEIQRLRKSAGLVSVKSSFELDQSSQLQICQAIQTLLKTEVQVDFANLSSKGWGIEIDIEEQRLAWNIEDYLDDLGSEFDKALTGSIG